ncbi:unnamed protein product [Ectocarpus sp. CCAP 1310/34]|nr:unnamed protein product [Ectocarpus sp. CCAP 1310/34]
MVVVKRRQVHLYHACSLSGEGEAGSSHVCGVD